MTGEVDSGVDHHQTYFAPRRWETIRIPVGTLRAHYAPRGLPLRQLIAQVTADGIWFQGVRYDNPSPAARAAKLAAGARNAVAASEDGWRFWSYLDPASGTWLPLDVLRHGKRPKHSIDELLEMAVAGLTAPVETS